MGGFFETLTSIACSELSATVLSEDSLKNSPTFVSESKWLVKTFKVTNNGTAKTMPEIPQIHPQNAMDKRIATELSCSRFPRI